MDNLEDVITDAVNDSALPEEPVEVDASPEVEAPVETSVDDVPPVEAATETPEADAQVETPAAEEKDEFEQLAGVPKMGVGGRENRIPYSRVQKITAKATEKALGELAEGVLGRKLTAGEKPAEVLKNHVAQIPELTTKVTDYETRLTRVGEFEDIMANQPQRFLQMLEKLPAYQNFFSFVKQAYSAQQGGVKPQGAAAPQESETEDDVLAGLPEPDQELEDGSKMYSMDGLKNLLRHVVKQTEDRTSKRVASEIEARYRPIESEWRQRRHMESVLPVIRQQIQEARTWPMFNESEAEITAALEADPNISLEGAYRKVVFPKLRTDRDQIRQQVLQEVRQAPRATAVTGAKAPATRQAESSGPRSLEDIIKEQVQNLK